MIKGVYIGLGSNLEQPFLQIKKAINALESLSGVTVINDSGYFKSSPMGPEDQPNYVNAVVEIQTKMNAVELLQNCQLIEQQQGREKKRHWGERTVDLDILLYADEMIESDELVIPHPGICQRDFVYMPLLKLNEALNIPGLGLLKKVVQSENNQIANKTLIDTDYGCQYAGRIDR